jgi:branched-chain amino acid transport system permease protein
MNQIIITILNGLTVGALYFLVASGFSLIFGLLRVVNMAHGSFFLIAAYVGWTIWNTTQNWVIALFVTPIIVAIVGVIVDIVFLRRVAGQDVRETLVTIALSIIIADIMLAVFGGTSYIITAPPLLKGSTALLLIDMRYPTFRLFTVLVTLIIGGGLWLLLMRTRLGMIIRAGIDDRPMVSALGFNIETIFLTVFGLGIMLAGIAGVVGGTALAVSPGEDGRYLLNSLIVVIIGGMGSIPGAALGAVLVGLVEQFGLAYVPTYSILITLGLMIVVLAVRPQGLLGRQG